MEIILDTILEVAELVSADASELLCVFIYDNLNFHKLMEYIIQNWNLIDYRLLLYMYIFWSF